MSKQMTLGTREVQQDYASGDISHRDGPHRAVGRAVCADCAGVPELVQLHGLERVREPHVKHLEGLLWEMRISGQSGIARAVYVTAVGKRV